MLMGKMRFPWFFLPKGCCQWELCVLVSKVTHLTSGVSQSQGGRGIDRKAIDIYAHAKV